ncbi:unnamed protein product [Lactuca saligna]|uniref:Uncharacterized protein n=1 Tax=Lactuca saligna TaxID=75948 RepID=A0AA35Y7F3_LACSI|nr:unnamed protein product [Lactuca saligna]
MDTPNHVDFDKDEHRKRVPAFASFPLGFYSPLSHIRVSYLSSSSAVGGVLLPPDMMAARGVSIGMKNERESSSSRQQKVSYHNDYNQSLLFNCRPFSLNRRFNMRQQVFIRCDSYCYHGVEIKVVIEGNWTTYGSEILEYMRQMAVITYAEFKLRFVAVTQMKMVW